MAVDLVDRHTAVEVDDMRVVERLVVSRRSAEVVREHLVVRALVDTADGQHGHRHGIGVVRVLVEIRILVADGGGFDRAVGDRLVRGFGDIVLLHRSLVFHGSQGAQIESFDRASISTPPGIWFRRPKGRCSCCPVRAEC